MVGLSFHRPGLIGIPHASYASGSSSATPRFPAVEIDCRRRRRVYAGPVAIVTVDAASPSAVVRRAIEFEAHGLGSGTPPPAAPMVSECSGAPQPSWLT